MIHWNVVAVAPPLHRGVAGMAQLPRHLANAAEVFDDVTVAAHDSFVRALRTRVKLEHVQRSQQYGRMPNGKSVGTALRELKDRSGLSLGDISKRMGDKPRSTAQRYFEPGYKEEGYLDLEDAVELCRALVGKGEPPITQDEILDLTALPLLDLSMLTPDAPPLSKEVTDVLAEMLAMVALGGQAPSDDVKEVISTILRELSLFYQTDSRARSDPAETRGALRLLIRQASRPDNGS